MNAVLRLAPIERRIKAAVAGARQEQLEPKSIYLTPDDRHQLLAALEARGGWQPGAPDPAEIGGLTLRRVSGRGRSRLYCRHGIHRAIRVHPPP